MIVTDSHLIESVPLALPGADIRYLPRWLPAERADALLQQLQLQASWEVHKVRIYGREHASPRLSCWMGDADASYRYSGVRYAPQPWLPALDEVRERLSAEVGVFNSVLLNRYRDGRDAMGWHSDDERELGVQPLIASLSLGATRRFVLKSKTQPEQKLAFELGHGSLLLMAGDTQRNYRHALPRTAKPVGERINLTFRNVLSSG